MRVPVFDPEDAFTGHVEAVRTVVDRIERERRTPGPLSPLDPTGPWPTPLNCGPPASS